MKEMQAILHVKKVLCNLLNAFSGFELLIFLSEYDAMSCVARKLLVVCVFELGIFLKRPFN